MAKHRFSRGITLLVTSTIGLAVFVGCISLAMRIPGRMGSAVASLVLPDTVRDLGRTPARHQQRVPFEIRNVGTRRLVINESDAGCGCGDPVRKTIIVPPGHCVEVTVTLDTRFATGPVEQIAAFTTSDPAHPRFNLTVRAWVDANGQAHRSDAEKRKEVSVLLPQKP